MSQDQADQADQATTGEVGGKLDAKAAIGKLLERIKEVAEKVTLESRQRKSADAELEEKIERLSRANAELSSRLDDTASALFITLSLHMDLISAKREHPDAEVAEEARKQVNMALAQQGRCAPDLYMRVYGVDPATGQVLPGRQVGVPLGEDVDAGAGQV